MTEKLLYTNDIDSNNNVLLNIAKYNLHDFATRSGINTNTFDKLMDVLPPLSKQGPWLAGGSLRRLLSKDDFLGSDLDFFFNSKEQMDSFESELKNRFCDLKLKAKNTHATTYCGKIYLDNSEDEESIDKTGLDVEIQLININHYNTVSELLDSFDFTLCQLAWDGSSLYAGEYSLWDIARKKIVLHKVSYPVASLRRLIKYSKQGYYACSGCLHSMLKTVAENPELVNVDIQYVD